MAFFSFSSALATISCGIGEIVRLAHLKIDMIDLQSSQIVELKVLRAQQQYFEVFSHTYINMDCLRNLFFDFNATFCFQNGISNPDVGEMAVGKKTMEKYIFDTIKSVVLDANWVKKNQLI